MLASCVALGACGGEAIDAKGAELLQAEVAAARNAAARGDGSEATAMLQTIDRTVDALREQDKITASRADDVHAAVDEVRGALFRSVAVTTTVPVTSAPATVAPVPVTREPDARPGPDKHDDGEDNGPGKGPGKGPKKHGDD